MSRDPAADREALKKVDELDIGSLVVQGAKTLVKNRPVGVSMWVIGLLIAAFANGFSVDDITRESYTATRQMAEEVERTELAKAERAFRAADDRYYNAKGWFWSCDNRCQKLKDQADMAKSEVHRLERKRDQIMTDARREVGIWSTFGVREVRDSFWKAWQWGKDTAARMTMYDAMFAMFSSKEETAVSMILKLVFQYIVNLTMGLVMAFFGFLYSAYTLVVSYGEPTLSGIAFFLLVVVAGMATVGTYLCAIYGTVVCGGAYVVKQAAKAQLEGGHGGRPRQIRHGDLRGGPGGYGGQYQRPHYQ